MASAIVFCIPAFLSGCSKETPPPVPEPAPKVRVLKVEPVVNQPTLELTGTVISQDIARVHPEISGTVLTIAVREGDSVQQGMELAQVDPATIRLALLAAEAETQRAQAEYDRMFRGFRPEDVEAQHARVRNAREMYQMEASNLERNQHLHDSGVMTDRDWTVFQRRLAAQKALVENSSAELTKMLAGYETYDIKGASAALSLMKAKQDLVKRNLSQTTIQSPISGVVTRRMIEVGQLVSQAQELFEIQNPERIWLLAEVGEKYAAKIAVGQSAELTSDALPLVLPGRVDRIAQALNATTHSLSVWLAWEPGSNLPPIGVFARATLQLEPLPDAFTLKREWVHVEEGRHFVWEVSAGKLRKRPIVVGEDRGDEVSIREGLEAGVLVVVSPPSNYREGVSVISEPHEAPTPASNGKSRVLSVSGAKATY